VNAASCFSGSKIPSSVLMRQDRKDSFVQTAFDYQYSITIFVILQTFFNFCKSRTFVLFLYIFVTYYYIALFKRNKLFDFFAFDEKNFVGTSTTHPQSRSKITSKKDESDAQTHRIHLNDIHSPCVFNTLVSKSACFSVSI